MIELQRDEDGGFMDLQAIRYAAMVASMRFDRAVDAHRGHLSRRGTQEYGEERLLAHLVSSDDGEPQIDSVKPRIALVSGNFSRELTTSVVRLNDAGLDVHCIRVRMYGIDHDVVLDIAQFIPLPEAEDYMVGVREKVVELEKPSVPEIEWTRQDVARRRWVLKNPTLMELFNLCAARAW